MGNTASSKERHQDSVDFGALQPQGIYTGPQDWNHNVVTQLIIERKLAPFYTPLEDYEDTWDDEQILAARKQKPSHITDAEPATIPPAPTPPRTPSAKGSRLGKEPQRLTEAQIYRTAVECPICFMYYPPNINHSRCCFQAICTECFVQVKRAEPTTTHLVSEPACCPYCVQENFGVTYSPPPWRAGIGSDGNLTRNELVKTTSENENGKARRKSFGHNSPEVVTTDQIRPDWEAKLAAVKAAVTRRANRRIIMRQVGDRLIPVGVTSGRVHAIQPEGNGNGESAGERSGRRRNGDLNQLLGSMGLGGQDLEELMMMEAMRLSLIEHEEQQRRQAAAAGGEGSGTAAANSTPIPATSQPSPSHALSASVPTPSSIPSAPSEPRRRSNIPVVPSPLGNASNAIALAIGFPSSEPPAESGLPPPISHRRSESSPPSVTTLSAAISAASTATAFLRPSSPQRDAVSAPVTRGVSPDPPEARTSHPQSDNIPDSSHSNREPEASRTFEPVVTSSLSPESDQTR